MVMGPVGAEADDHDRAQLTLAGQLPQHRDALAHLPADLRVDVAAGQHGPQLLRRGKHD